jgi:hypothetical protein
VKFESYEKNKKTNRKKIPSLVFPFKRLPTNRTCLSTEVPHGSTTQNTRHARTEPAHRLSFSPTQENHPRPTTHHCLEPKLPPIAVKHHQPEPIKSPFLAKPAQIWPLHWEATPDMELRPSPSTWKKVPLLLSQQEILCDRVFPSVFFLEVELSPNLSKPISDFHPLLLLFT